MSKINTNMQPAKVYSPVQWLFDQIPLEWTTRRSAFDALQQAKEAEKDAYIRFFLFFRENGEKYIGLTIEQFVDEFIKQTYGK